MTRNTDEAQIRELVEHWAEAVRRKDLNGAVARHADNMVMFDVPMPLQSQGIEEYKRTWQLFFANTPGGPGSFDLAELHVTASATVGYCHGLVKVFNSTVRLTIGLRKENEQWLIAHEHHSYPIELKAAEGE